MDVENYLEVVLILIKEVSTLKLLYSLVYTG